MSYLVLARKWRPQTFADIVGQEHVTRTLQNAIRAGRIAHAFLFTGVRGVGKTTAARVLAKALNCEHGPTPEPCNHCEPCGEIARGQSVDVIEIDGASNTGVDDVRAIIENVRYQPAAYRFKIYIIDEVHMLSTSAFNALLKTLEEPPPHVKFVFATTDPHKVPATVQSRCQRYDFRRIPLRTVVQRLAEIARAEGVEISERALFAVAREAEGSMRDAQSLLDQLIAYGETRIADEHVYEALGLSDRRSVAALANALLSRDCQQCLSLLHEAYSAGHDLRRLARELLEYFHDLSLIRVRAVGALRERWGNEEIEELEIVARKTSPVELDRFFRGLMPLEGELARVPFPKLLFEMALIRLATQEPLLDLREVLEELRNLEHRLNSTATDPSPPGAPSTPPRASSHARSTLRASAAHQSPGKGVETGNAVPTTARGPGPTFVHPRGHADWAAFVRFTAQRRPVLATHLEACPIAEIHEDRLVLEAPRGHHFDYLEKTQNRAAIEALASEFFGRTLKVIVNHNAAALPNASQALNDRKSQKQSAAEHPLVRAAVEILGAQIQEVRPRSFAQAQKEERQ